jgi:hypothetical protein
MQEAIDNKDDFGMSALLLKKNHFAKTLEMLGQSDLEVDVANINSSSQVKLAYTLLTSHEPHSGCGFW